METTPYWYLIGELWNGRTHASYIIPNQYPTLELSWTESSWLICMSGLELSFPIWDIMPFSFSTTGEQFDLNSVFLDTCLHSLHDGAKIWVNRQDSRPLKIDSFERMSCDIASKYCPFPYEGNGLGEHYGNFQVNISNKPEITPYGFQNKQPPLVDWIILTWWYREYMIRMRESRGKSENLPEMVDEES